MDARLPNVFILTYPFRSGVVVSLDQTPDRAHNEQIALRAGEKNGGVHTRMGGRHMYYYGCILSLTPASCLIALYIGISLLTSVLVGQGSRLGATRSQQSGLKWTIVMCGHVDVLSLVVWSPTARPHLMGLVPVI
jgi:hypothetical protein